MIKLKPATIHDSQDIFMLRQDPAVSKYLFSNNKFTYDEHVKWLQEKLADDCCHIFVIKHRYKNKFVGTVRFDGNEEGKYEISLLLSSEFHGQGLGKLSLREGLALLKNNILEGTIVARVHSSNIASLRLFQSCGFMRKSINENHCLLGYNL